MGNMNKLIDTMSKLEMPVKVQEGKIPDLGLQKNDDENTIIKKLTEADGTPLEDPEGKPEEGAEPELPIEPEGEGEVEENTDSFEIYFHDLSEEAQKRYLEFALIGSPEEGNLADSPIAIVDMARGEDDDKHPDLGPSEENPEVPGEEESPVGESKKSDKDKKKAKIAKEKEKLAKEKAKEKAKKDAKK